MDTIRLAWQHIILQIPSTWELIAYQKPFRDGRLSLADRRGEAMQVFWQVIKVEPAIVQRLVNQVKENVPGSPSEDDIRRQIETVHGWTAFMPEDEHLPVIAGRYAKEERALLNITFPPHPSTRNRQVITGVLKSYQPNYGRERVWAAFGMEITLPQEWELTEVAAFPAAQTLRFENKRGESVTTHRYGMMPLILEGTTMAGFFAAARGRKALLYREGDFAKDGKYPGVKLHYTTHGRGGWEILLSKIWQGNVWIWRCDDIKRLFCLDHNAHAKHMIPDLPDRMRSP
jgi:hypothetical protein